LALCLFIYLAFVDPPIPGSWMVRDPVIPGCYLLAAAGLGLILYARDRDLLFIQDWQKRRRRA